jgi:hypothetical protein
VPFCGEAGDVHHLDVRFLAVVPDAAGAAPSAESLEVRWWPATGLPTDEPGLVDLVRLGRARLSGRSTTDPQSISDSPGGGSMWAAAE